MEPGLPFAVQLRLYLCLPKEHQEVASILQKIIDSDVLINEEKISLLSFIREQQIEKGDCR